MRIALTGNPNSGKTTMFNALTGSHEQVGNWAGVTVEKKEQPVKKSLCPAGVEMVAVDLPGAYSMSPFTSEESITRDYVTNEKPDVIINIVDATNLSRSLFFTTQLLELGVPVVVALNKTDVNERKQTLIDLHELSRRLCCPVVETVSTSGEGLEELLSKAAEVEGKPQKAPYNQGKVNLSDHKAVEAADRKRFEFVNKVVARVEKRSVRTDRRNAHDRADELLTHPVLGTAIFALVMYLVFQLSQAWVGPAIAEGFTLGSWEVPGLVSLIDLLGQWAAGLLENAHPVVTALLVDGIIGGVGAVVGFLPLVMVMYFFIALLEDCGYMARVSVLLDPLFKKVGLSGKSVIPFVIGVGCAVPGVMACRTIRNDRERRAAALLAPFMPCGAKLPVISLFVGAFFKDTPWMGTLMYLVGIVVIFLCALLVNGITGNVAKPSYFIMELPEYKIPSMKRAAISMCSRGWEYVVKAATVILLCNTAVQLMQSFTWGFQLAETADSSILASVAGPFAYVLLPVVGVLSWELAAAAITGFIAKENVVGTLAVCFVGLENLIDAEELALMEGAGEEVAAVFAITKVAALAYLMFNLFTPPCFAAIGAMNAEMKSARWLWGGIALQLSVGFSMGYLVYTVGTLLTAPETLQGLPALIGLGVLLVIGITVTVLSVRASRKVRQEAALRVH